MPFCVTSAALGWPLAGQTHSLGGTDGGSPVEMFLRQLRGAVASLMTTSVHEYQLRTVGWMMEIEHQVRVRLFVRRTTHMCEK